MTTDREILIAAKKRILTKKNLFVCHAIDGCRVGTQEQKDRLYEWIDKMLGFYTATYEGWIRRHHPKLELRDTREGRLQWLDWMIENCGDK